WDEVRAFAFEQRFGLLGSHRRQVEDVFAAARAMADHVVADHLVPALAARRRGTRPRDEVARRRAKRGVEVVELLSKLVRSPRGALRFFEATSGAPSFGDQDLAGVTVGAFARSASRRGRDGRSVIGG